MRELYQEVIIDHNRHPRNFAVMTDHSHYAEGFNPLCGDRVHLFLNIKNNKISAASFQGSGCAIATASASIMTEILANKDISEVQIIFDHFHALLTADVASKIDLGKLTVLAGVREFPARVKCATLAWHTLMAALKNKKKATTE